MKTPARGEPSLEVVPQAGGPRIHPDDTSVPGGSEGSEPSLGDYLDVLVENRRVIVACAAAALVLGVGYALLAPPTYRSDVLVQVEQKKGALGLGELGDMFGEATPADTEIEILRSRSLVGAVVDELRLDVRSRPVRFPVVGGAVARRWKGDSPRSAPLGLGAYGWGGERVAVERLSGVQPTETLTLVARGGGRYELLDEDGAPVLAAAVGQAASGRGVELYVSELVARPGTEFTLEAPLREEVVAGLQKKLRITEKGKKTGVLQLSLEGEDREEIAAILDSLSRHYLRQNVERRSAEAEKTLEFLGDQLPALRGRLDAAEVELEAYRSKKGTLDVSMATKSALDRAVEVEKGLSELQLQYAALKQRFTDAHPAIAAVRGQIAKLESERARIEGMLKALPEAELESARRLRDVKVSNELYLLLLNKSQELKIVKEGTIGNVRILDAAIVPAKPVAPKKAMVAVLSLLLGLGLGVGFAFARKALDHGVEDPEAIERAFGVGVHASVPLSQAQVAAERARRRGGSMRVLAASSPDDLAVESLRSLRTSLQFALLEAKNNVVAVGGPAPGVGKSFVSANLAHLLGEAGKRVVVADADLRRGHLHRFYGGDRERGLSDVIGGSLPLQDALRPTESPSVQFLATGTIPPNPAELLASERFQRVLSELSSRFDLVILDLPPILAVTDAAVVGRLAGLNLMVLRAGRHPMREIAAALRALGRGGVRVQGFVLNGIQLDRGLGRKSAYHYQYKYLAGR